MYFRMRAVVAPPSQVHRVIRAGRARALVLGVEKSGCFCQWAAEDKNGLLPSCSPAKRDFAMYGGDEGGLCGCGKEKCWDRYLEPNSNYWGHLLGLMLDRVSGCQIAMKSEVVAF